MCARRNDPLPRAEGDAESEDVELLTSYLVPESRISEIAADSGITDCRFHFRTERDRVVITSFGARRIELINHISATLGSLCHMGDTTVQARLVEELLLRNLTLSTAESCTGGLIAKLITDVPGSSSVFWGGVVAYDNSAKRTLLSVSGLPAFGAVSAEVAQEMASGALLRNSADIAISVTGIAGPGGGSDEKPVGTVFFGIGRRGRPPAAFGARVSGGRDRFRRRCAVAGLLLGIASAAGDDIDGHTLWNYI